MIKFLTIHCAATPEGRPVTAAQITEWDKAKFGQTSYHWVVEIDGRKVRTLADKVKGAHVYRNNTGNIGICYIGGVAKDGKTAKDTRTAAQKQSLRDLVTQYRIKYPGITVRGHRDWSPDLNKDGKITPNEWVKGCPSFDVATQL
jgi:N-acetylmuramoyl-L-alanine amidase